ncbi:protein CHUP1, chloroplastic [Tanacetum coccineum]
MALAISTTKAEHVAAGRACQQALWMKQAMKNYDIHCEDVLVLCDNKVEDEETKLMKETPYELLKDTEKKELGKNEEAKMTIYNALPRKEYERGNRFGLDNRFGNGANRFGKGRGNSLEDKGGERSKKKEACYNCGIEGHFANECRKLEENKAFMGGAWNDSKDGNEHQTDPTFLMAIDSKEVVSKPSSSINDLNIIYLQKENEELLKFNKDFTKTFEKLLKEKRALEDKNSKLSSKINDLEIEVKKLVNNEVVKPCQKCVVLTQEVDSLTSNVSKLQNEALNFSKFKSSSIALDDMLSRQKLSQDKEGLGSLKIDKTTSASPNKPIVFVKQIQKEIASTSFVKPVVSQTHFTNTRGPQAPIRRVQTKHQGHHSGSHSGLGYTQPRVDHIPLLPTPHMRPSNSYARRPSF